MIGFRHSSLRYWPPLLANEKATRTQPQYEKDFQQSINNFFSWKSGQEKVISLYIYIIEVLDALISSSRESDTCIAPSWQSVTTELQQFLALHHGGSKGHMAVIVCILSFNYFDWLKFLWTLSCSVVFGLIYYCPGGCWVNVSCLSACKRCQLLVYGCLWLSTTLTTPDGKPKLIDAQLSLIFQMWQG